MSDQFFGSISEVAAIDYLLELSSKYRDSHGRSPIKLSHWDPSENFAQRLVPKLPLPKLGEPYRYRYSCDSSFRAAVLTKLGYSDETRRVLLTENGTNAMLATANSLSLAGVERAYLVSPRYFATHYALSRFGIEVMPIYWEQVAGEFALPPMTPRVGDVLWVETPIFSTGVCPDAYLAPIIEKALAGGSYVVWDRSVADIPVALDLGMEQHCRFISFHAPNKTICMNGLKFGAAVFHENFYDSFDHWQDVLSGGLSLSAETAIEYFLSKAFDAHSEAVSDLIEEAWQAVRQIVQPFHPLIRTHPGSSGYWRTIYAPGLPAELGHDPAWLARMVDATGAVPIPGTLMGCSPQWGFCFRINLLRFDPQFRAGLRRFLAAMAMEQERLAKR